MGGFKVRFLGGGVGALDFLGGNSKALTTDLGLLGGSGAGLFFLLIMFSLRFGRFFLFFTEENVRSS